MNKSYPDRDFRCDHDEIQRPPIFKQLMEIDEKKAAQKSKKKSDKMSDKLTEKLSENLRHLLIEEDNLAEKLCALGSTSHAEAYHGRIVTRGFYTKGDFLLLLALFDLIRLYLTLFDLI